MQAEFWGNDIIRERRAGYLFLSQKIYMENLLNRYGMSQPKSVSTPLSSQLKLSKAQEPKN